MKKIWNLVIALFIVGSVTAQKQHRKPQFTPEQKATLKTKKMDLHLDLNKTQEEKIYQLALKNAENRAAKRAQIQKDEKKKRTAEEKYLFKLGKLERQLANQEEMKTILNAKQYDEWKLHVRKRHAKKKKALCKAKTVG